ncbi:hypothetical protein P872_00485 [Rhodonellum psychrophilum GCM71 = DSM 17998]|uniref:Uncharacterized protein n=2 Tax=Rhodonellum TaxID=336827 RepID=U5C742_9BACT|nr:hypothetical protein P872_00485 [Rhodonellum psychrophilum GCM71 = DSM 17998]SDY39595.1 hypothetical protein SAMN05444412_10119 [Rhodonellum ikkaensis]
MGGVLRELKLKKNRFKMLLWRKESQGSRIIEVMQN